MSILKGYNKLKKNGDLEFVVNLKSKILNETIILKDKDYSKFVFDIKKKNFSFFLNQAFFCKFIIVKEFSQKILLCIGSENKFSFPIPSQWINIIKNEKIKISKFDIYKNYFFFSLFSLCKGFLYGLKKIFLNIKLINSKFEPYIYFVNLNDRDLPSFKKNSYDTISWFIKYFPFNKNTKHIFHTLNHKNILLDNYLIKKNKSLFKLKFSKLFFYFIPWFILSTFICLLNIFKRKGYESIFFKDAIDLKLSQLCMNKYNDCYFLFNNSSNILRDLWTYNVEDKGGNVYFYFYSLNNYPISKNKVNLWKNNLWRNMSWKNYLTWNKYNSEFVKNANIFTPNILNLGPIWNSGSKKQLSEPFKYIAVFDITPLNNYDRMSLALGHEFLTSDQLIKFVDDIYTVSKKNNLKIILKSKKMISENKNRKYYDFIQALIKDKRYFSFLDHEFSSIEIIQNSVGVISLPFTSTAHQALDFNKPSIFYESTGYIDKNSLASNGINTLIGINELTNWIESINNEKK